MSAVQISRADRLARSRRLRLSRPLNLGLTLAPLAHGRGDPTTRVTGNELWRATRTADGPATLHLALRDDVLTASAWGPGAERLLDEVPILVAENDATEESFRPHHPVLRELARRLVGLRMPRTNAVLAAAVPAVIEQKVTGIEARRSYRGLIRAHGEPAPGPASLALPPSPETLARLPYYALHSLGLEQRRADVLRRLGANAARLEEAVTMPAELARARLRLVPGIGPWTAAEVTRISHGDADAVSVGDFHVPNLVAWVLAGEPRADDARMLELLEPYRGNRGRVVRLLEASGIRPPAFAPRVALRSIEGI